LGLRGHFGRIACSCPTGGGTARAY
jgi:hypothetical protein